MDNQGFEDANGRVFAITRYASEKNVTSAEHLVNVRSRGSLIKAGAFYKRLSVILCVLFVVLVALLIAICCMYFFTQKPQQICTTTECLRSAANMRLSMDPSADPCEDFYQFTCGKWSEEHPNHRWYPKFSTFETIEERLELKILEFLEANSSSKDPLPVKQSRDFFRSCVNVEATDRKGYGSALKYLRQANLSVVPQFLNASKSGGFRFDWLRAEAAVKKVFYMDVFIGVTVDSNVYDTSNNSLYLGTPGHDCPLPRPFQRRSIVARIVAGSQNTSEENREVEERQEAHKRVFKFVVRSIFSNLSVEVPKEEVLEEAYVIMYNISDDFDAFWDNYTNDAADIEDYSMVTYTIEELQNLTDDYMVENGEQPLPVWNKYLSHLCQDLNTTFHLDGTDRVIIDQNELWYLPKIIYYLLKLPDEHLELYMWWAAIYAMIINTTSEMVEYISKQTTPFASGDVIRSRSLECADLVTNFMGMAVSYGIADRAFLNRTKPKVQEMLREIKESFIDRVNQLSWMDKKTKVATLMKAQSMVTFIGYPEWLYKPGRLEKYYIGINIRNDSYLENMMEFVQSYLPYKLERVGRGSTRTWRADPITVNAYNYFSDNSINVPMAILSFPVYHLGLEVLNYAAIGTILGHELTHGFDNIGRKFDAYGSYNQWWSNKTIEAFENYTECFVKQYSNYSLASVEGQVDGRRTLGENLADNGGLHHAFTAYKRYISKHGPEPTLPGFEDYSADQLFFIGFGNVWCETSSPEVLQRQLDADEHCPNVIRVLGTLQNSYEFSEAFRCPVGSKMNPGNRCRIW